MMGNLFVHATEVILFTMTAVRPAFITLGFPCSTLVTSLESLRQHFLFIQDTYDNPFARDYGLINMGTDLSCSVCLSLASPRSLVEVSIIRNRRPTSRYRRSLHIL